MSSEGLVGSRCRMEHKGVSLGELVAFSKKLLPQAYFLGSLYPVLACMPPVTGCSPLQAASAFSGQLCQCALLHGMLSGNHLFLTLTLGLRCWRVHQITDSSFLERSQIED